MQIQQNPISHKISCLMRSYSGSSLRQYVISYFPSIENHQQYLSGNKIISTVAWVIHGPLGAQRLGFYRVPLYPSDEYPPQGIFAWDTWMLLYVKYRRYVQERGLTPRGMDGPRVPGRTPSRRGRGQSIDAESRGPLLIGMMGFLDASCRSPL